MKLKKLQTITEKQYERLRLAGIEVRLVGKKTTVQQVLKFMRSQDAIELINLDAPLYSKVYVVNKFKKFVAEVIWHKENEWNGWFSKPVDSWEEAESLALDFMLGTLDEKEYPNYKINKSKNVSNICKCCGNKMEIHPEPEYCVCINPYCDNYVKIVKVEDKEAERKKKDDEDSNFVVTQNDE
jgi:hypothetical protein